MSRSYRIPSRSANATGHATGGPLDLIVRYHREAAWSGRSEAIAYARGQNDDTYPVFTSKFTRTKWYCSKLVWRAYREATGDDLDSDWGFYVFPNDIEQSGNLHTVYRYIAPE